MIDGEDDVKVVDGQQPHALFFQPLGLVEGATGGALSVLAGVVCDFHLPTFLAGADVAAHSSSLIPGSRESQSRRSSIVSFRKFLGSSMGLMIEGVRRPGKDRLPPAGLRTALPHQIRNLEYAQ